MFHRPVRKLIIRVLVPDFFKVKVWPVHEGLEKREISRVRERLGVVVEVGMGGHGKAWFGGGIEIHSQRRRPRIVTGAREVLQNRNRCRRWIIVAGAAVYNCADNLLELSECRGHDFPRLWLIYYSMLGADGKKRTMGAGSSCP